MDAANETSHQQSVSGAISGGIVSLLKSITGRGPTKARTHVLPDCVVVLMREGHTTSEGSLAGAGHQRAVAQNRVDLSEAERARFIEVVERVTGRTVISFLTSSHQDPSIIVQVFVLDAALSVLSDQPDID